MLASEAATFNVPEVKTFPPYISRRVIHATHEYFKEWKEEGQFVPQVDHPFYCQLEHTESTLHPLEDPSPVSQTPEWLFRAQVLEPGYVSFKLNHGITVNIGPNYAIQIINDKMSSKLALSGCATQMALVHPQGRILQYAARIEVQCPGPKVNSFKSAKIWPRGISFTSTKCAITYLVDEAGTRSTSDYFFNLFHQDNTDCKIL